MTTPKRILIVDDDRATSRLLELGLERTSHYHVRVENHSPRAVATARLFRPDLVVLDIVMPEMDGGDVTACLKKEPDLRDLPILFLTSLVAQDEATGDILCSGGLHYLAKPVNLDKLIECIECLLAGIPAPACQETEPTPLETDA